MQLQQSLQQDSEPQSCTGFPELLNCPLHNPTSIHYELVRPGRLLFACVRFVAPWLSKSMGLPPNDQHTLLLATLWSTAPVLYAQMYTDQLFSLRADASGVLSTRVTT